MTKEVETLPQVCAANTWEEAIDYSQAIPDTWGQFTASSLVACIDGRVQYLTPGAFHDHIAIDPQATDTLPAKMGLPGAQGTRRHH